MRAVLYFGFAALLGLFLYACGSLPDGPPQDRSFDPAAVPDVVPRDEPLSRYGNPARYVIDGREYRVLRTARGYVQRGVASWYGKKFHGRRTSSGERYDMYALTAAHPTLPIPCYARVTNLDNGRSLVLRINDRGPFEDHRLIDLSYAAAARLGVLARGTARVEVRTVQAGEAARILAAQTAPQPVLMSVEPSQPAESLEAAVAVAAAAPELYFQVGAFGEPENAERLLEQLRLHGIATARLAPGGRDRLVRVYLGPLHEHEYARLAPTLRELGIRPLRLAAD